MSGPAHAVPPQPGMALLAEPGWQAIDFISDLHLQASQEETFCAWAHYMAHTCADALFILGDLFEVWVGDDIVHAVHDPDSAFVRQCQLLIGCTAQRLPVHFIHGNRDFLLGQDYASGCGMRLLPDPCVLDFDAQRWLLSHGDALCLDDADYQTFRQQVRSLAWRTSFLAKPLHERQSIARGFRQQSQERKASAAPYADADRNMARQWLAAAQASTLIHGHTHRPADHELGVLDGSTQQRLVLSDWDARAHPPRLEVLRLRQGSPAQRLSLAQACARSQTR